MMQQDSKDLEENERSFVIRYEESFIKDNEVSQIKSFLPGAIVASTLSVNNRMFPSGLYFSSSTDEALSIYDHSKEFKKITDNGEFYEGDVLLNNFHGHGFYQTQKNGQKLFYDGLFYLNKLEGYSQIFYENGTYFQGLFKQHKRYGPGVLTYPNGHQDVGFWDGFTLARLSSVVGSETVPRLANTVLGRTRLLGYRYLVPLCDESDSIAKDIFNDIGAPEEIFKYSNVVLNVSIRNPNSLFFHKELFDYQFFGGKDCTIKVAVDENESFTPSEEEEKDFSDRDFRIKIERIRSKIREINENIEPYEAIKYNLQKKIYYCTQCCNAKNSFVSTQTAATTTAIKAAAAGAAAPGSSSLQKEQKPTTPTHQSIDGVTLDLASLMPDDSPYNDASFTSFSYDTDFDIDQALQQMSATSSKQNIINFCICDEQELDDLQNLEDQLSNIIKQETFYTNIRNSLQKRVNSIIEKEENKRNNPQPKFKLVEVTELWAWNNEELLMEMQKHCFKHRNSEGMVNFNVPNLILGNRKDFGEMGEYENICYKFLISCSKGKKDFVRRCLRENINPNMADARGNSGIFFAAAKDQIEIISILTNFGAKLDQINDDELTSLSLCILKYLSQKNKCDNWEKAFLPETEICTIPNPPKWYDIKSIISQSSTASSKQSDSMDRQSSQNDFSNSRIVELFRRLSNLQQKTSSFIRNVPNTAYVLDLGYKNSESNNLPVEGETNEDLQSALKATHLTIMTLLDYGADPNVAKVPYPPLVLSLFSENPDLVAQLLQANANVNTCVTEYNLSCLHVLCSLCCSENTIEICRLLLLFKCDPNLRTLPTHWEDQNSYYRGNIPEEFYFEECGKKALHLLCMRKDFESDNYDYFGEMSSLLITGGTDCSETYLGHTPLSLAVLAGNVRLVKYLIKHNIFDPYENLPYYMGNVLTLLTLKRFENTLPTDKCKAMLTALFDVDVNVLYKVGDSENAIAFTEEGDALLNLKFFDKDEKKSGIKVKPKPATSNKFSQSAVLKEFLKDLGRNTIIKEIQMIATEILYDFTEENMLEETGIAIVLAEFLDPHIAIHNLEVLIHSEKIHLHRLDHDNMKNLLNFVNLHQKIVKVKKPVKVVKQSKGKKGDDTSNEALAEDAMENLILKSNFRKSAVFLPRLNNFVVTPGFDDPEIYKVCFHCLKGQNKELKLCPRCQMVRFCSAQCNKLNLKVKTQHNCNLNFYEEMKEEELEEMTQDVCISLKLKAAAAKEKCNSRLHKKREIRLVEEERKLLEMWRADKYGTKFLKFKPLLQKVTKDRKTADINVDLAGLQKLLERNFQKNPADFDSYSIEALMYRFSNRQRIKESRKSARSSLGYWLGSRLGSRVGSVFSEFVGQEKLKQEKNICECSEKTKNAKQKRKSVRAKKCDTGQTKHEEMPTRNNVKEFFSTQFEDLYGEFSVKKTRSPVMRKLRKIPSKYQKFIEIMGTYFPEVDMSYWLLPYACCSNGQLFYKFCDNEIFRESYSLS